MRASFAGLGAGADCSRPHRAGPAPASLSYRSFVFLAQIQPDTPPKHSPAVRKAVGNWAALTLVSVLILLALGLAVLALFSRSLRRNQQLLKRTRAKSRATPDPWREAGRRAAPDPSDPSSPGSDDDTVDLDPPPDPNRN